MLLNNGKYTKGIIKFEDYCDMYFLKGENCRKCNQAKVVKTHAKSNQRRIGVAYPLIREKFLVRVNKLSHIRSADWNCYLSI